MDAVSDILAVHVEVCPAMTWACGGCRGVDYCIHKPLHLPFMLELLDMPLVYYHFYR